MKKFYLVLISLMVPMVFNSCSIIASGGGKRVSEILSPPTQKLQVRKHLGAPIRVKEFPKPVRAYEVKNLWSKFREEEKYENSLLGGYEDYKFVGWLHSPSDWAGIGMLDGFTFGLGGLVLTPNVIKSQMSREHQFRVYYDIQNRVYGYQKTFDSYFGAPKKPYNYIQRGY